MIIRFIKVTALVAGSVVFVSSCGDNSSFQSSDGVATNSGTISQNNFSLLTADVAPGVIDLATGVFTKTDVELTVFIGDRNNQTLTDAHTINFVAEYGLVEPSCITVSGSCSVTWSAIKRPDPGGPGSDGTVTITAYTTGEEGFSDSNGNGIFDDADGANFDDLEEPFIDADENFVFSLGDVIIDVVSINDPTGVNGVHDIADGFFNGSGCSHTSLCGINRSITIFDSVSMSLTSGVASRTIGGDVIGLATGASLTLQNNGGDDLTLLTNGPYTFATPVDDGLTYTVIVSTQPTVSPNQTCNVTNASGTVSANVTNVDVTCTTNAFTIGGTVSIPATETLTIRNTSISGGSTEDLNLTDADTTFVFTILIEDTLDYDVTEITYSGGGGCTFTNETGTVANVIVNNIDVTCL